MTSAAGDPVVLPVEAADDGARLDRFVGSHGPGSRAQAAAAISAGRVLVDGRVAAKSRRVRTGEHVEVTPAPAVVAGAPPPCPPIRWQDEHLLVVSKPAGLVVHPGVGHVDDTLVDALRAGGLTLAGGDARRPGIVHRLDKDTSGLLLVAKTEAAHAALTAMIRDRVVERRYVALVDGSLPADHGRVEAPIARHARDRQRFTVDPDGRHAITHWQLLRRPPERDVTLVGCRLETGRTHQIRVHLRHAGAPVAGDPVYGRRSGGAAASLGLGRPGLHAAGLALDHPVSGERLVVVEPLPDDLADAAVAAGFDAPDVAKLVADWSVAPEDRR